MCILVSETIDSKPRKRKVQKKRSILAILGHKQAKRPRFARFKTVQTETVRLRRSAFCGRGSA